MEFFKKSTKAVYRKRTVLLAILMGYAMAFGQPLAHVIHINNSISYTNNKLAEYTNGNKSESSRDVVKESSKTGAKNLKFSSQNEYGFIGEKDGSQKENPKDNFFNIDLPANIDFDKYNAVINYELYGVDNLYQTTKSINNNPVYGGMVVENNEKWQNVEEYINTNFLKKGMNSIFFNRRVNENYSYQIKNLSLKFIEKNSSGVTISGSKVFKKASKIYATGFVPQQTKELYVDGKKVEIENGVFEFNNEISSEKLNSVEFKLTSDSGDSTSIKFPVEVESSGESIFSFSNTNSASIMDDQKVEINYTNEDLEVKNYLDIEYLEFKDFAPLNSDLLNVTNTLNTAVRITRSENFKDASFEATISIPFSLDFIPDGYSYRDVKGFYFDAAMKEWKSIEPLEVDCENLRVVLPYMGDTDYVNGVLQAPEMAETNSFTPTTITDMEYANPSAQVVGISPPSANNSGTVNTAFPIKLPSGRNGLSPQVALNYSSEGGNGWTGLGWNLQLPAITIDSRWGVPTFDINNTSGTSNETELYLLNGSSLVLKHNNEYTNPHRSDSDIQRQSERIFYNRVEGGYQKIIRHGNAVHDYYWEVVDRSGIRTFYGGTQNGIDNSRNSVIHKDGSTSNPITHWAIKRQLDPFGNYIDYQYDKGTKDIGNGVLAQYFYPSSINYTLHNSVSSYYKVSFNRDSYAVTNHGTHTDRKDILLQASSGTLMITDELLTEIEINFINGGTESVRMYSLEYESSRFNKSQLSKISELDSNKDLFYTNSIEYFDELNNDTPINSNQVTWSGSNINIAGQNSIVTAITGADGSALGTSTSSGVSGGLRVGVGFGLNAQSVNTTVGGSTNYSAATEKSHIKFFDINGDGLPDRIVNQQIGGQNIVGYNKNLGGAFDSNISIINKQNSALQTLDETKSRTFGFGFDANAAGAIGAGKSWSTTNSTTTGYFTDFNGDGLPDMNIDGTVHFNHAIEDNPVIGLFRDSQSLNKIEIGSVDPSILPDLELESKSQIASEYQQFDHVKVWKAPSTGLVSINGVADLKVLNPCEDSNYDSEVRVTLEHNKASASAVSQKFNSILTYQGQTTPLSKILNVTKGDYLYFRIHNDEYGCGAEVEWNPTILYSNGTPNLGADDLNGNTIGIFSSTTDYLLTGGSFSPDAQQTSGTVSWNLNNFSHNAPVLSDDVYFTIIKTTYTHNPDGSYSTNAPIVQDAQYIYDKDSGFSSSPTTLPLSFPNHFSTGNGNKSYTLEFKVSSDSNIDWNDINWQPSITLNSSGSSSTNVTPGVSYEVFNNNVNESATFFNGNIFPNAPVDPNDPQDGVSNFIEVSNSAFNITSTGNRLSDRLIGVFNQVNPDSGEMIFKTSWVTKSGSSAQSSVLHKKVLFARVSNCFGAVCVDFYLDEGLNQPININSTAADTFKSFVLNKQEVRDLYTSNATIQSAFYFDHTAVGDNLNFNIDFKLHPDQQGNYTFTTKTLTKPAYTQTPEIYGEGYQNWGQFLYNGGIAYDYDQQGNIIPNSLTDYSGLIDPTVFQTSPLTENEINTYDPNTATTGDATLRYTLYNKNLANDWFTNDLLFNNNNTEVITNSSYGFNNSNELTAKIGRFGVSDIFTVYVDENDLISGSGNNTMKVLDMRTKSKGGALSGNLGTAPVGGAATISNATSKNLVQYVDLNGDRYPDLVTPNLVQYTNMKGALTNANTLNQSFSTGGESEDETFGSNIAGMFPNSTTTDNPKSDGAKKGNNTNTNINSGLNFGQGETKSSKFYTDINGDGLPDRIIITESSVLARINLGYTFSEEISWGSGFTNLFASTRSSASGSGGGGLSGAFSESTSASFAVGLGASTSTSQLKATLLDINGDGLPDLVNREFGTTKYYLNLGNEFSDTAKTFYGGVINQDTSVSGNIYGSATFGFSFTILTVPFKVTTTPSLSTNGGITEKEITYQDINGDGYVDILQSGDNNGSINAQLNLIGRTHLLKKVNLPLGGSWEVDYEREGNEYNLSYNKWVLSQVKTNDGFAGDQQWASNETLTRMSYEDPVHHRRERTFLGFGEVRVEQRHPSNGQLFRYTTMSYHNSNVYLKGAMTRQASFGANDELLSETVTEYDIFNADSINLNSPIVADDEFLSDWNFRYIPLTLKTTSTVYENGQGLSSVQEYSAYDSLGNVTEVVSYGDTYTLAPDVDGVKTNITYTHNTSTNINLPTSIEVRKLSDNSLSRKREATYYLNKPTSFETHLNSTESLSTYYNYDSYGNIRYFRNIDNGTNYFTHITYDTVIHTLPTQVQNAYNEISSTTYDYKYQLPLSMTDMNNNTVHTRYDDRSRIIEVIAPGDDWTLRMQYEGESLPPLFNNNNYIVNATNSFIATAPGQTSSINNTHYAVTRHHVPQALDDQLFTVSIADGLGKAIQIKKSHFTNESTNGLVWLVEGKNKQDVYGRTLERYLPTIQMGHPSIGQTASLSSTAINYDNSYNTLYPPAESTYDVRDRIITTTQPGESQNAANTYAIESGFFTSTATNEKGQTLKTFTDVRGRQRKTVQNSDLTTSFFYDHLGQQTRVRNHQGYETKYWYDLGGRTIQQSHPDRGVQQFKYDKFGNLIERTHSNLIEENAGAITYDYNFTRLTNINYPQNPSNNVTYTYGDAASQGENVIGKLFMQEDATGVQLFNYDELGNMSKHYRGVAVPGKNTYWFNTQWEYDHFNRVQTITYPDNEVVNYKYNTGGKLSQITRQVPGIHTIEQDLVSSIKYNDLGERSEIYYGNGTSALYTYDDRRRINTLQHSFTNQTVENEYGYDELSNITSLETVDPSNSLPAAGQIGGAITHNYTYDNYNRLAIASGRYTGANDLTTPYLGQEYTLNMEYDLAHNIISKTQSHQQGTTADHLSPLQNPVEVPTTSYHLQYGEYATGAHIIAGNQGDVGYVQPHAAREIIETPDDNPYNQEDSRYKKTIFDFDANGNQTSVEVVINHEDSVDALEGEVAQERMLQRTYLWDEENRLRAVNLNPEESGANQLSVYTYDAGGERVVRHIPSRLDTDVNATTVSKNESNKNVLYPSALLTARTVEYKEGGGPTSGNTITRYTKHYYLDNQRINSTLGTAKELGLFIDELDWLGNMDAVVRSSSNSTAQEQQTALQTTYAQEGQPFTLANPIVEGSINTFNHNSEWFDAYWYHPDHLGSSSYITNTTGIVTQHLEYLPFGEALVEEHQNSHNTPYKFNGKEQDAETGNYYYGARYYNPKFSTWLSVDPLAEQMPEWSSYAYAFNNPLIYTDPTGMAPEIILDDIYLNCEGFVSKIVENDNPNRFFDENGDEIMINDSDDLDKKMLSRQFYTDEKVYNLIDDEELNNTILSKEALDFCESGYSPYPGNPNPKYLWYLARYAKKSYYEYDFGYTYLKDKYDVSLSQMYNLYEGTGYESSVPFTKFNGSNVLYNLPDAGNFMWGKRAFHNNLPLNLALKAAGINEGGEDTSADSKAITSGYKY